MSALNVKKRPVAELVGGLMSGQSKDAGLALASEVKASGLNIADFLRLAVVTDDTPENAAKFANLDGFGAVLKALDIPLRDDMKRGHLALAAGNTFTTYPGSRLLFPEVVDQVLRQQNRLNLIERTDSFVSNSRTINGNEVISTYADMSGADKTYTIAEGAEIPVQKFVTTQNNVALFKHGSGYEFTYEFDRRVQIDLLTPYAARIARRLEISKVAAATYVLINGDGVNAAAATVNLSTFGADYSGGKTLKDNYRALAKFIMYYAQNGYSFDTLVCNFDTYVELMFMFTPTTVGGMSVADYLVADRGTPSIDTTLPLMNGMVKVALSSQVPANKIIALTKAECVEELVEANSMISESERAITNQTIRYVKTENTGYKLNFPDARVVLDVAN